MFANQTSCDLKGPCITPSKLDICTVSYVNLNIHSLDHLELYKYLGPHMYLIFFAFKKIFISIYKSDVLR